jgi:hypothetical protein
LIILGADSIMPRDRALRSVWFVASAVYAAVLLVTARQLTTDRMERARAAVSGANTTSEP